MTEENEKRGTGTPQPNPIEESQMEEEGQAPARPAWREIFRQAFDKARREQKVTNRRELGRDRSRTLFLLAGAAIAVLLLFLGVFSSNTAKKAAGGKRPGVPDLGRRETPGQQANGQAGSVTPLLNAQTGQQEPQGTQDVTPEDIGRTARPIPPSTGVRPKPASTPVDSTKGPYTLEKIDFSDPTARQQTPGATTSSASEDARKPSLVFVRNMQSGAPNAKLGSGSEALEEIPLATLALDLPAGTRLVARLESVVNSAIKTPVVAAIEYNYERDGQIVVPAGAKALGGLQQADRSGVVAIRFDTLQMPDGSMEKIEGTAMSLTYGPLKGNVSGRKTGTRFLVRTFTGLGTAATYLIGAGGTNGFNGPLSQSALLRDRVATNIGIAGDQELNSLAFNQNIVVTVPGNTRFYVVLGKSATAREEETRPATRQRSNNAQLPTAEELRQLMQLRRELSEMAQQTNTSGSGQQVPQQ
jgi:hypothetical protein